MKSLFFFEEFCDLFHNTITPIRIKLKYQWLYGDDYENFFTETAWSMGDASHTVLARSRCIPFFFYTHPVLYWLAVFRCHL